MQCVASPLRIIINKRLQNQDYTRIYHTTSHEPSLNQRERQRDKEREVKEVEEVGVHHEKRKLLGHSYMKRRQISKTQRNRRREEETDP